MNISEHNSLLNIDCPALNCYGDDSADSTVLETRKKKRKLSIKLRRIFPRTWNPFKKEKTEEDLESFNNRIRNLDLDINELTRNNVKMHGYFNWSETNIDLARKLRSLIYKSLGLIINEETMVISNIKKLNFLRNEIPWFLLGRNGNYKLTFQDFEPLLKNGEDGYLESNAISYIMSYLTKSNKCAVIHCTLASELLDSHFEGKSEEKLKSKLLNLPTDIEVVFLPLLSLSQHFKLLICDLKESRMCLLDSLLAQVSTERFSLQNRNPLKKFEHLTSSQERYTNLKHIRISAIAQNDGHNCGLYIIKYASDYLESRFPLGEYFETNNNSRVKCNTYRMHLAAWILRTELTKNDRTEECSLCFKEKSELQKCDACQRMLCEECEADFKDTNKSKCRLCDPNI